MGMKSLRNYFIILIVSTILIGCSEYKKLGTGFVGRNGYGYEDKKNKGNFERE